MKRKQKKEQRRTIARIALPVEMVAAVDREYAALPQVACRRKCSACCSPVGNMMTVFERDRIVARTGRAPNGFTDLEKPEACNMLTPDGACSVYDIRPTVCRLYGVDPQMPCLHNCAVEGGGESLAAGAGQARISAVRKAVREYESPL